MSLQQLLQQRRIDVAALEKTARGRGVVGDGGERLIEFMRDRCGHFAHQSDAVQMRHLLALDLQLQVGLLLRADIDRHTDESPEDFRARPPNTVRARSPSASCRTGG